MSAIIRDMGDWADSWLSGELCGGLRGRSADQLHERMMADIDEANEKGEVFVGAKVDLKKCFDTVAPEQCLVLWEEWGGAFECGKSFEGVLSEAGEVGGVPGGG